MDMKKNNRKYYIGAMVWDLYNIMVFSLCFYVMLTADHFVWVGRLLAALYFVAIMLVVKSFCDHFNGWLENREI